MPRYACRRSVNLFLPEFIHEKINALNSLTDMVDTVGIGYTNKALACIAERSAWYTGYTLILEQLNTEFITG